MNFLKVNEIIERTSDNCGRAEPQNHHNYTRKTRLRDAFSLAALTRGNKKTITQNRYKDRTRNVRAANVSWDWDGGFFFRPLAAKVPPRPSSSPRCHIRQDASEFCVHAALYSFRFIGPLKRNFMANGSLPKWYVRIFATIN